MDATRLLRAFARLTIVFAAAGNALAIGGPIEPAKMVIEYVNDVTGHYVLLTDPPEQAAVEAGAAGPGWRRTSHGFLAMSPSHFGGHPVCRFYSPRANSHFFTGFAQECEALKAPGSGWLFEGVSFHAFVPPDGHCGTLVPVYRLYNDRGAVGDPNHRFTTDARVRAAHLDAGWRDEGLAFCVQAAASHPEKLFQLQARAVLDEAGCRAEEGSCVALAQLAPMGTLIPRFLPPSSATPNPDFPSAAQAVTGLSALELRTALPSSATALIPQHSFLQMLTSAGGPPFGIHVNGADRLAGAYASVSPMVQLPRAVDASGTDRRVFPWRDGIDRALVLASELWVRTLERASAGSHAYGHPTIELTDASTGRSFSVTVQAFGSVPAGDFVAADAATGRPIVSTVFRPRPLFGESLGGAFVACGVEGAPTPCLLERTSFRFRMRRADLQAAVDRARMLDPALSARTRDYFVAGFRFRVETFLEARVGMMLDRLLLEIFSIDNGPGER